MNVLCQSNHVEINALKYKYIQKNLEYIYIKQEGASEPTKNI